MKESSVAASIDTSSSSSSGPVAAVYSKQASFPIAAIASSLAAGFVLKVVFISGPLGSDDLAYFDIAQNLFKSFSVDALNHHAGRMAFLILSGLPAFLFGSIFYGALANVVYCLITEILVIRFVFERLGPFPATVSAVFLAFSGLTLTYAGVFVPEPVLTLFFTISCLCVFRAIESPDASKRQVLALYAGLAAGLAYSAKDAGILMLPPAFIALLLLPWPPAIQKTRIRCASVFLAGFLAVWLLESLLYWAIAGDFLYKSNAVSGVHNSFFEPKESLLLFLKQGYWNFMALFEDFEFFFVPVVLAFAAWSTMLCSRSTWLSLPVIGLFAAAYLFFGSSSLSKLVNLPSQTRYVYFLFPLIAIGVGYLFAVFRNSIFRALLAVVVVVYAAGSVHGAAHRAGDLFYDSLLRNTKIALSILPQLGQAKIYVDGRYLHGLIHVLPESDYNRLSSIPLEGPLPAGYYLLFHEHVNERFVSDFDPAWQERFREIVELPVAMRVEMPHSFASRYFFDSGGPSYGAIVHEKRN